MQHLASTKVTHIIHIADIHVRTGDKIQSRSVEYEHVFNNFIENISQLQCVQSKSALLVIAGDVFHNKGRFETEGAIVFFKWINQLLTLLPILIIAGNHDFRQEDPEYIDTIDLLITPYSANITPFPIHYLKSTGHYVWGDIGFGVCSVKDTLRSFNTSGTLSNLPTFPDSTAFPNSVKYKIALFHGSIIPCHGPYPIEWFSGYGNVLLGDYHKQIVKHEPHTTWGYPGSLVQQDDGEPTFGHGYLLWDVNNCTVTSHEINNDFSNVNFIQTGDQLYARFSSQQTMALSEAINMVPRKARIKLIGFDGQNEQTFLSTLSQHGIVPSHVKITKTVIAAQTLEVTYASPSNIFEINQPTHWHAYIQEKCPSLNVQEWILNPKTLLLTSDVALPSHILEKMQARNKLIQKSVDSYENSIQLTSSAQQPSHVHIRSMDWAYIMCYGPDNSMVFEPGIVLINAPNASGKSSLVDVICIGLYGEPTFSRYELSDIKMTAKIINDDRPAGKSAFTKITVECNSNKFEIKRTFGIASSGNQQKQALSVSVHQIIPNSTKPTLIAEGGPMVTQWIQRHFGSLPEMMMSSILCQFDNVSFFHLSSTDQKATLDKSMHLETIANFQNILDESIKAYKAISNDLSSHINGMRERFEDFNAHRHQELTNTLTVEHEEVTASISRINESLQNMRLSFTPTYTAFYQELDESAEDNDVNLQELLAEKTSIMTLAHSYSINVNDTPDASLIIDTEPEMPSHTMEYILAQLNDVTHTLSTTVEYIELELSSISLPAIPPTTQRRARSNLTQWKTELDAWSTFCSNVPPHSSQIMLTSQRLHANINTIKSDVQKMRSIPSNSECWACQQQCVHITEKEQELKTLRAQLKRLQRKARKIGPVNEHTLALRSEYESRIERMTYEMHEWALAEKEWAQYDDYVITLRRHTELQRDLKILLNKDHLQKQLHKANAWKNWMHASLRAKWINLQCKFKAFDSTHNKQARKINQLEQSYKEASRQAQTLANEISTLNHTLALYNTHNSTSQSYSSVLLNFQERLERLERFKDVFIGNKTSNGFKADIYQKWVLPLIKHEINTFLDPVVDFTVAPTMSQNKLVWTVHDRGNVILLSHCSGFQRFIIGLAMRATLCKIGAAGHSLKMMIIDEGFTCCDTSNLQYANIVLKNMMDVGGYTTILLMSHLDAIRELSEKTIHIHRHGRSSFIRT